MLPGRHLDLGQGFVVVAVGEGGGMPLFPWIRNQTEERLLGSSLKSRNWDFEPQILLLHVCTNLRRVEVEVGRYLRYDEDAHTCGLLVCALTD